MACAWYLHSKNGVYTAFVVCTWHVHGIARHMWCVHGMYIASMVCSSHVHGIYGVYMAASMAFIMHIDCVYAAGIAHAWLACTRQRFCVHACASVYTPALPCTRQLLLLPCTRHFHGRQTENDRSSKFLTSDRGRQTHPFVAWSVSLGFV